MAELTTRAAFGTDVAAIVTEELQALRGRIAANIVTAGSNVTGATIESLQTEVAATDGGGWRGTLYARPFFGALETGSKPWTNQYKHPPVFFREIIQKWIDDKGLDLSAYAVARKIMREGSKLYREGGRDTIYSQEIPRTIDAITQRLSLYWATAVAGQISLTEPRK